MRISDWSSDVCSSDLQRLLPEEARQALERGVTLLGAASTGAELAARLAGHGMIGHGRVFDLFRSGRIQTDDIAVLHAPDAPFTPFTVPQIGRASCRDRVCQYV